jgi:hypothetical protein
VALQFELFELDHQLLGVADHATKVLVLEGLAIVKPLEVCLHGLNVKLLEVDFASGTDVELLGVLRHIVLMAEIVDVTLVHISADIDLSFERSILGDGVDESRLDLADLLLETLFVPHVKLFRVGAASRSAASALLHNASSFHFELFSEYNI